RGQQVAQRLAELPDHVARTFCRVLSPSPDLNTAPSPEEVTRVALQGEVRSIKNGIAEVIYSGDIAGSHKHPYKDVAPNHGEATLTGLGKYNVQTEQLESLLMLFRGTHRPYPPYDAPRELGAIVEWKSVQE
ncbi:MAG: hypothetical protein KY475_16135, partial [Planctomycetes bacterium]|nr:hypothetical protein [Planctomycetota bacterium]